VLFIGNALLDISAKCDEKLLEKYDLKLDDNCEAEEWQLPIFDQLLATPDAVTTPGKCFT
jgi:sugar/nucleoside kinase (ribokinase family)